MTQSYPVENIFDEKVPDPFTMGDVLTAALK